MKIRQGFVSNSSSSSFIVSFPKGFVPTTESVKQIMFGDTETLTCYGDTFKTERIAEVVTRDMINQKPNIVEDLTSELEGDDEWTQRFSMNDFRTDDGKIDWVAYREEIEKFAAERIKEYDLDTEDLYIFSYSDNDGAFWSAMEHGGIFDALKHKRFSHH